MKELFASIPLVALLCVLSGCQEQAAMAELEAFRAQAKLEEQNEDLTRRLFDNWGKGNFDALDSYFAPNLRFYYPSNSQTPMSLEGLKDFGRSYREAVRGINWTMNDLFASGDKVVMRFTERGTQTGELMGIPASGNSYEVSGTAVMRIEGGMIVEYWEDFDALSLNLQLGMELKPKE